TGKFLPGNRCGSGNPHYRKLAANRTAFLEAVGPEQVKALAAQLLARALAGDLDAAPPVPAYAPGRPQPAAAPHAPGPPEWRARREWPIFADLLGEVPKIPLGEALDRVRWLWQRAQPVPLTLPPLPEGAKPDA